MRAHFLQYIFIFLLVHNSEYLENLIKSESVPDHILMWSGAQWVKILHIQANRTILLYTPYISRVFYFREFRESVLVANFTTRENIYLRSGRMNATCVRNCSPPRSRI